MGIIKLSVLVLLGILSSMIRAEEPEPIGLSMEKQLFQQMLRTEIKVDLVLQDIRKTEERVLSAMEQCKADTEKNINEIKDAQTAQANLLSDVKADQEVLKRRVSALTGPAVAFVARALKNIAIDDGETLVFSTIVLNNGSGYNKHTGIFTVPVTGVYQFIVRLCVFVDSFALIEIVSEDVVIMRTRLVDEGKKFHSCSEVTGYAVLDEGKRVWVISKGSTNTKENVWNDPRYVWNTFSGMLINTIN